MQSSVPSTRARWTTAALVLFACAAFAPTGSVAQSPSADAPTRPRIGLALSGGGARGAAHIGVLKVLDELRVPVHCIAGTSMGSVVGGSFAAGTTPAEMEAVITKTDWNEVFTDRPPRGEIAIRRKQDDYKPLFAPEFGFRDGSILLPQGLVAGVTIESFLRYLTEQSRDIQDFSKLPVPFRAVAADIATGEAVIIGRGSLAQAMRASMAIPGAVDPVERDGRLLVDGGIANNLPIDVVRKLCGDVIIAVNIGTPPLKREEITSALSIVGQLVNLLGKDSVDRQLATLTPRDVLIAPDLGDISSGSFERQGEAIRIGEAAAREAAEVLKRYSIPAAEYAALRKTQIVARGGLGTVEEIRFEGIERTNAEVLAALLESRPGEELTEEKVAGDLRRIYGRGDFDGVDYRIDRVGPRPALVFNVREKSIGPAYLRFGLGLASDFQGENYFNALVQYRSTWINRLGGEWVAEAQVGQNTYFFTEFYQPIEARARGFVAPYARVGEYTRGVFVGDDRIAEYRVRELQGGLDLGATLGTWGELRLGPVFRHFDADVETGSAILPDVRVNASGARARLFADRLDTPFFPRSGHRLLANAFSGADRARGGRRLSEARRGLDRRPELRAPYGDRHRGRRDGSGFGPALVRFVRAGRAVPAFRLPDRAVLREEHGLRPPQLLQPGPAPAVAARLRRLPRCLGGGRPDGRACIPRGALRPARCGRARSTSAPRPSSGPRTSASPAAAAETTRSTCWSACREAGVSR